MGEGNMVIQYIYILKISDKTNTLSIQNVKLKEGRGEVMNVFQIILF